MAWTTALVSSGQLGSLGRSFLGQVLHKLYAKAHVPLRMGHVFLDIFIGDRPAYDSQLAAYELSQTFFKAVGTQVQCTDGVSPHNEGGILP